MARRHRRNRAARSLDGCLTEKPVSCPGFWMGPPRGWVNVFAKTATVAEQPPIQMGKEVAPMKKGRTRRKPRNRVNGGNRRRPSGQAAAAATKRWKDGKKDRRKDER